MLILNYLQLSDLPQYYNDIWWCSTKYNQLCKVAVQHRDSAESRLEKSDYQKL